MAKAILLRDDEGNELLPVTLASLVQVELDISEFGDIDGITMEIEDDSSDNK